MTATQTPCPTDATAPSGRAPRPGVPAPGAAAPPVAAAAPALLPASPGAADGSGPHTVETPEAGVSSEPSESRGPLENGTAPADTAASAGGQTPWPVWLGGEAGHGPQVLEGFAGPGGLSEGLHMVGLTNSLGIDLNADACATAEAAGHRRLTASILDLDPDAFPKVRGWVSAPPCQTFTQTGKQSGMNDYQAVLDGLTTLGNIFGGTQDEAAYRQARADVTDPRTALVLETLKFAFRLPRLQWVVAEQVPQVCEIWRNIAAELACAADFRYCDVVTVRADDLGAPTRRIRTFLVACRWWEPDFTDLPLRSRWSCGRFEEPNEHPPTLLTEFPLHSMAGVLGWPAGVSVNTRGARKTAGGNEFSADQPAISLTGNGTRTWYRTDLGSIDGRLGSWQAGLLQGFPEDYPWKGSRSSRFQRCADTVSPLVAAAVIGVAARRRGWKDAVWQRLGQLYGAVRPEHPQLRPCEPVRRRVAADQLDLFSEAS